MSSGQLAQSSLVSLNNLDDAILYQSGTQGEDRCASMVATLTLVWNSLMNSQARAPVRVFPIWQHQTVSSGAGHQSVNVGLHYDQVLRGNRDLKTFPDQVD